MKYVTFASLIQRLLYITPSAVIIYLGGGVEFLVVFFSLSTLLNVFINYHFAAKYFSFRLDVAALRTFTFDKRLFKQASVFSFLWFVAYFYSKIDIVMLSWFLDHASVGIYSAGYKLIQPMELIGQMAAISFFPLMVKRYKEREAVKIKSLLTASSVIFLMLAPISLFVTLFSEEIISVLYGATYVQSHLVLKYLCWMIPLSLVTLPLSISMQANIHEKRMIMPVILRALSNITLNYILLRKYGLMGVVYSTMITYSWYFLIVNFGYQFYILKKAGNIL
jgi:O-antigen/teichoic acid export membrane protein